MTEICALIPFKGLSGAKTRLAPLLQASECAALAECMLRDVLTALCSTAGIDQVVLFGNDARMAEIAREFGCRVLNEAPGAGLCKGLDTAAAILAAEGVERLLIIHGDLPSIKNTDISALLNGYCADMVICPAGRDGGTNALIIDPPDTLPFQFGQDSARRHMETAARLGIDATQIRLPAAALDIDTPDDLRQFCTHPVPGHTWNYLRDSGIAGRLEETRPAAMA